jgi:tryptophan-rich sensory protein
MKLEASNSLVRDALGLCGWILLCFAVAGIASRFTAMSLRDWYPGLRKPALTPPGWVFGPVWSALYLMMAVAAWLVWLRRDRPERRRALAIFVFQLAVNAAWSGLFFGLKSPLAGLLDIAVLWCAVLAAAIAFAKINQAAGWMLAPYLGWVAFAGYLNAAIWLLNA